jgi:DNA-binding response OmpR family regulator
MTAVKRILLVDDDGPLRQSLAEQLRLYDEFETDEAETAEAALAKARGGQFDAILLDVGLPDMDGRDLCRAMRRAGVRSPVILLTVAGSDADVGPGLESGANDSVTKPFRLGVLLARLRTQLRQSRPSDDVIFAIGPYSFRPAARLLQDDRANRKVRLTAKETAILKYLYLVGEKVVGREVLLGEVWGYNAGVTTHTLETHVYRLRQKIEADPSNARILITEPGGYRLVP